MPPRGLKKILKDTAPCKLVGAGFKRRFEMVLQGGGRGQSLRGLTKRLEAKIFSFGQLPAVATAATVRPGGGHWRGRDGGRRRGSAVDAQVSRLAGMSAEKRFNSKMLVLTRLVFSALSKQGLEPVMGQRAVCSNTHRIGTAADIVCHDSANNRLVLVELKCGHTGSKTAAAVLDGKSCNMQRPLHKAADCVLHRHLSQLAVTHNLFCREKSTLSRLGSVGIDSVDGMLLYACDEGVEVYPLVPWWKGKAVGMLESMS